VETVLRALAVYAALLGLFRVTGPRTLAQLTTFDFVLLLILAEAVQNALVGDSFSLTTALLLVMTLVGVDVALSVLKRRWPRLDRWLEGLPVVLVADGRPLRERMAWARVDEDDVLAAARHLHGLGRMAEVRYAVLERSGGISIIPRAAAGPGAGGARPRPGRARRAGASGSGRWRPRSRARRC